MAEIIDGGILRDACGHFATGVTIVATSDEGQDHGMTANAFMSVSLDPPLVCVSLNNRSKTLSKIEHSRRFSVSILNKDMAPLARAFSGRGEAGIHDILEMEDGLPAVKGAQVQFFLDLDQSVAAGDHTILLGKVTKVRKAEGAAPLLYYRSEFLNLERFSPA